MHVWRIPFMWRIPPTLFADLVAGSVVTILLLLLSIVNLRSRTLPARIALIAAGVASVILSPFLIKVVAHRELTWLARHGVRIGWTAPVYWLAGALALIMLLVALWLFPDKGQGKAAVLWRLALFALCLVFAVLNVTNWCNPGWCDRYGFPFSYYWWSDGILVMNGENLSEGFSILACVGNAIVAAAPISVLVLAYRRRTAGEG